MEKVVVVSAVRTPIGKLGGKLKNIQPEDMFQRILRAIVQQNNINTEIIDEIIVGQAKQSTDQPNIARVSSLMAEFPDFVPAYTVHRQCASGMQAVFNGVQQIQTGYSSAIIAGGVESMSTAPFYIRDARFGLGSGNRQLLDPNVESQPKSQPEDIYGRFDMIQTAENVAEKFKISREEQDQFAYESQQKANKAIENGKFKQEVIPLDIPLGKGQTTIFDTDEYPRKNACIKKMSELPSIYPSGTVTAGNASGRNDGASALLLMSESMAKQLNLKILGSFLGATAVGVDPRIMGIAPVAATRKLLKSLRMNLDDFGLIEINEAFAAQAVACIKELGIKKELVNTNGGAIALGHPLGCSGARIITTLLHEMEKRDERFGLATICVAGGLGMSIAFERE